MEFEQTWELKEVEEIKNESPGQRLPSAGYEEAPFSCFTIWATNCIRSKILLSTRDKGITFELMIIYLYFRNETAYSL